jgi:hypothetical protein
MIRYRNTRTDEIVRVRETNDTRTLVIDSQGNRQWVDTREFNATHRLVNPTYSTYVNKEQ